MSVFFDDVDLDAGEQIPTGVMAGLLAARPIRPAPRPGPGDRLLGRRVRRPDPLCGHGHWRRTDHMAGPGGHPEGYSRSRFITSTTFLSFWTAWSKLKSSQPSHAQPVRHAQLVHEPGSSRLELVAT